MDSSENVQPQDPNIINENVVNFDGTVDGIKYRKEQFLGKGGFAECYLFTRLDESQEQFAAKIISKATLKNFRAK